MQCMSSRNFVLTLALTCVLSPGEMILLVMVPLA